MAIAEVILVTGGTGLVGSALKEVVEQQCTPVKEHWVFASSKDADLTSLQSTEQLFDRVQPTQVLHLAARVGGLYANSKDNVGFFRQNMAMQVLPSTFAGATACLYLPTYVTVAAG